MIGKFRCTKDFWNDDYSQKKVIERLQLTDIGIVEDGEYLTVVGDSPYFDKPRKFWRLLFGPTGKLDFVGAEDSQMVSTVGAGAGYTGRLRVKA